ncbi:hypothetical protein [Nonlabens ponticola]|uniref:hypothetical protein n=1 Tax=Nonlabens ponticola TaxID=2496866 RepID=UPI0013E03E62|nr:hypothetical protein [Nonlabens ponticola]
MRKSNKYLSRTVVTLMLVVSGLTLAYMETGKWQFYAAILGVVIMFVFTFIVYKSTSRF